MATLRGVHLLLQFSVLVQICLAGMIYVNPYDAFEWFYFLLFEPTANRVLFLFVCLSACLVG